MALRVVLLASLICVLSVPTAHAAPRFLAKSEPIAGEELTQTNGDHALGISANGQMVAFWGTNEGVDRMRASLRSPIGPFAAPLDVAPGGGGTALPQVAGGTGAGAGWDGAGRAAGWKERELSIAPP